MIIDSLLDTDLYKFTMMQVVLHQFPGAQVAYRFKCRSPGVNLAQYADEIEAEIKALDALRFQEDELNYLRQLRYIKGDFVDFLALFHFNSKHIQLKANQLNGELALTIQGSWLHTILYEVPILAIINEVYFRHQVHEVAEGQRRLDSKLLRADAPDVPASFTFTDFGTRRRFSKNWQRQVLKTCQAQAGKRFIGTSNVMFAKELGLLAVGTMAHEYLQACQALGPRLRDSQKYALQKWADEYRGDLGIALSDVTGMKAFIRDFDLYFCKLFDGARHDSGDPYAWGEQLLSHYQNMRVDPLTKSMIFSDGLTMDSAVALCQYFDGRSKLGFGIGTNLTNDLGPTPLQIVIKMVRCNGQPVAKVSDTPGKTMCEDVAYLSYLKQVFEIET
ncbi:MAG: nicotinate phosphoribosyltransferase [Pseudomonadota bacterium]